ncbi:MAG: hypothetical protein ACREDZ_14080, partial [Kiloniellales bacterium]
LVDAGSRIGRGGATEALCSMSRELGFSTAGPNQQQRNGERCEPSRVAPDPMLHLVALFESTPHA